MKSPKKRTADVANSHSRASIVERFEEVKLLRKRVDDLERQARRQGSPRAGSNPPDIER
jgi:hypothetical protein